MNEQSVEFAVGVDDSNTRVRIAFEKPLQFFGLIPDDADEFAKAIITCAEEVRRRNQKEQQ